ncbi:MAG: tetratricopeptide repeat protein [Planctomycetota bacterium]
MGSGSNWSNLRGRTAGKWQLPLLAVSLVILAGALYRIRPTPRRIPFEQSLAYLDTFLAGRFYDRAQAVGRILLERPDLEESQRSQAELRMGRALYGAAQNALRRSAEQAAAIVEHYRACEGASHDAAPLTADDLAHIGRALEWQEQYAASMEYYRGAVDGGISDAVDLRKHMLVVQRDRLSVPPDELSKLVDAFMGAIPEHRLDLRMWALEEKLHLLDATGERSRSGRLLAEHAKEFAGSDFARRFDFMTCEDLVKAGRYDEAEVCLRTLRNQVDPMDEVSAMAGWLLGRVLTEDTGPQRPQEGLSFFDDVLRYHADGTYAVASRVGKGEALAMLERHDDAISAFQMAIKDLPTVSDARVVNPAVLRASLAVTAETQGLAGRLRPAVGYARLAGSLVDRSDAEQATVFLQPLAQMEALLAEQLLSEANAKSGEPAESGAGATDAKLVEARKLFSQAAQRFEELAALNVFDERRGSEFDWRAAELYGKAGDHREAIERYKAFASGRPDDPLLPRALLRIGQLHQAIGELSAAVEAYQECYRRFPRSLDGARALMPLARSFMAMGSENLELAEKTLRIILEESEVFTPEAPEFVDGLFLLGDVLERRGDYEQAIARMKEALDRYPDDARVGRARFLLADSFRKSAAALRKEAGEATIEAEVARVRSESAARFQAARELYRGLIRDLESRPPGELDRLEQLYLHHAYLYEADCYFETQEYARALKLYEQAAGNLRDTARGLAAYVQMVNCYVFMGESREARAALARALVVVDAMPDSAFESPASPQPRGDWKKYFEWLGESELF